MPPLRLLQQPAPRHSRIIARPLLDPAIRRRREIRSASINPRNSWIPSYARKRKCSRGGKFFRRGRWTPISAGVMTLLDAIGSDTR